MKKILMTMGGSEFGWSRHNDEGIFRDYNAEADRLIESAKPWGLECIKFDNEYILNWTHYEKYKETLSKPGFGFAFKPICFYETLKNTNEGDLLLFVDSNHIIAKNPDIYYSTMDKNSLFVHDHIWTYYPNRDWTKRDTFIAMGCDEERYWNSQQMHCCITGIKNNEFGRMFAEEYMNYCLDWRITFGENKHQNFPTFKENRHNQSVWSIMVEKYKVPYVNRTENVWMESIIPELPFLSAKNIVDNAWRREQDRKDIR